MDAVRYNQRMNRQIVPLAARKEAIS